MFTTPAGDTDANRVHSSCAEWPISFYGSVQLIRDPLAPPLLLAVSLTSLDQSRGKVLARLLQSRDRIGDWLRTAPIQATGTSDGGGIAGQLDTADRRTFVYGEVTGYWLSWSSVYAPDRVRMGAAVEFLRRQWSRARAAQTRLGAPLDWRNRAAFSFDLAMMMRGLAAAAPIVGSTRCAGAAARLTPWLERLVDTDGSLRSHLVLAQGNVPTRWSTLPGAYQAKTAAALLCTPNGWLPTRVLDAARLTLARYGRHAVDHRNLHARFYAFEGLLLCGAHVPSADVLDVAYGAFCFPEEVGAPVCVNRSDVQAQALRLLCLLPDAPGHTIDGIAANLLQFVRDDGSVAFSAGDLGANVWCALFAHQALDWRCSLRGDAAGHAPRASDII